MSSVYIIGDLRLLGSEAHIRRVNANHLPIFVDTDRGARLNRLTNNTINCIHATQAKVIIAGGINNCTFKDHHTGNYKFIFHDEKEMTDHIMYQFESIDQQIRRVHPTAVVAYCDYIGMDHSAYARCENPLPGNKKL